MSLLCKTSSQLTALKLWQCSHNNGKWLEVGQFSISFPAILKCFFPLQIKSKANTTIEACRHDCILLVGKVHILMCSFFLCVFWTRFAPISRTINIQFNHDSQCFTWKHNPINVSGVRHITQSALLHFSLKLCFKTLRYHLSFCAIFQCSVMC